MNQQPAGLPLGEQASRLVTFLNQHQHNLSIDSAVALCGALPLEDEKAAAKQLKTNLLTQHGIQIRHTHALHAIRLIRGGSGFHNPVQPKIFCVSARDPHGHAPRRENRFPTLKAAVRWLREAMGDELKICELPSFVRTLRSDSSVQFAFCSAGMMHLLWELWVEPVDAPQDGVLPVSDSVHVVSVIRALVEEERGGGIVFNAALIEKSSLHRSTGQLQLEVPGSRDEFDPIPFDGLVGNELELLVEAEKHFGVAALMDAVPEEGALVINGVSYTASLYVNGRRPAEPVFLLEPAPKQVLARLLRGYKRLVARHGTSIAELQRQYFLDEPSQVAIQGNLLAPLLNQDAGNHLYPSSTDAVPEKEWNLFLHTGKLSAARVLALSERFRVDPDDLIGPFGVERTSVQSVHGLSTLMFAADEFQVIAEGTMLDAEREQLVATVHRLRAQQGKAISQCAQDVTDFAIQMGLSLAAEEYWDFENKWPVTTAESRDAGLEYMPWRKICLYVTPFADQ